MKWLAVSQIWLVLLVCFLGWRLRVLTRVVSEWGKLFFDYLTVMQMTNTEKKEESNE